jgi:hypothetical protein
LAKQRLVQRHDLILVALFGGLGELRSGPQWRTSSCTT